MGPGPAQVGAHARDELAHRERLGDVVVGPELEPGDLVGLGVLRRDHDDRDVGLGPDRPAHVEARDLREHQVQDHQRRRVGAEPFERPASVGGHGDRVPLAFQVVPHRVGEGLLVLDDQDAGAVTVASEATPPGWDASVNSRNSPETRNATCSPISTALSPTRSSARAARFMCMPHSSARGSSASLATSRCMFRFRRSTGSSIFGRRRQSSRSRRRRTRPSRRGPSRRRCAPSRRSAGGSSRCAGRSARDRLHLRHVDRLVADAFQVQARVEDRPRPAEDRPLPAPAAPAARASGGRARGRVCRSRRRRRSLVGAPASSCWISASTALGPTPPRARPASSRRSSDRLQLLVEPRLAASAEPSRDVVLGARVVRVREDRLGLVAYSTIVPVRCPSPRAPRP